jgi:predicted permease
MLWQDLRYALRTMRRNGAFTAVAVVSLALGIGANTAIFSLIDTVMLRPLPVRDPGSLVDLLHLVPTDPWLNGASFDQYLYLRDHNRSLAGLIATSPMPLSGFGAGVDSEFVDGNYFSLLGVKPSVGRLIDPQDDRPAATSVAILSWPYWKAQFGFDPAVIGRQITIQDVPVTIVGVAPKDFFGIFAEYRTQVWLSSAAVPAIFHVPVPPSVALLGRLKPGVSMKQAQSELSLLYQQSIHASPLRRDPNWSGVQFKLESAAAGLSRDVPPWGRVRDLYSKPLLFLMAVVGLLLLIACTNMASMLLARGAARQREMALRVSLGAGRWRLTRQVLTESLLLSISGAACGLVLAYLGARGLAQIMASGRVPLVLDVRLDIRVLLFLAGAALLTGLLFGLAPALRAMATAPAYALRSTGSAGETHLGRLFGKSLVVSQVVIAAVLLSAAGLFLRHLSDLRNADLGFRREHILLATLNPSRSGYTGERLSAAYRELLDRLAAIPGVRSTTLSAASPISGGAASRYATVEGYRPTAPERRVFVNWIAPRFFETYGTPLLAGREFSFQDAASSHVAIVNQSMARHYFADANPIGRHVTLERDDHPFEIVGVVADAKYLDLHEPAPRTVYLCSFSENGVNSHRFALRAAGGPAALAAAVRRTAAAILKDVPVENMITLAAQMDASIVPERLTATLSALFGALGSLLVAIGIYGLMAYTVARRTNEIGVRMALGATRGDVTRMVLVDALWMAGAGLVIGVPLAIWSRTFAASLITGLPATNAFTTAAGAAVLAAVALAAAYLPARRASRVDPMVALRYE